MKERIRNFLLWIWSQCRDRRTVALLLLVMAVMYTPMWGGYLLHALFGWEWGSVAASAYLLFWAGPFTPFIPLCIATTLWIKRRLEKKQEKAGQQDAGEKKQKQKK